MGAAAVPVMIGLTVASTAAGVYSSVQQGRMAAEDARARGRQAAAQSREEEIQRLKEFKEQQARNMAIMAAGGLASDSGTLAQINQGNISSLEEDLQGIRATGRATQAYMETAANNARKTGTLQAWTTGLQGASSAYGAYNAGQAVKTPATGTGVKAGVSK